MSDNVDKEFGLLFKQKKNEQFLFAIAIYLASVAIRPNETVCIVMYRAKKKRFIIIMHTQTIEVLANSICKMPFQNVTYCLWLIAYALNNLSRWLFAHIAFHFMMHWGYLLYIYSRCRMLHVFSSIKFCLLDERWEKKVNLCRVCIRRSLLFLLKSLPLKTTLKHNGRCDFGNRPHFSTVKKTGWKFFVFK